MSRTWRLLLEYEGTRFAGWQVQPGQVTVQSEIQAALQKMFSDPSIRVVASGRTDAGVHALGQVVSFRSDVQRAPHQVRDGVNSLLPSEIACLEAAEVPDSFHAQLSATGKLYRYILRVSPTRTPLLRERCWQLKKDLDVVAMGEALNHLEGRHDFTSFRAAGCAAKSPIRSLSSAEIKRADQEIWIELYGEGFLRHMVRNVVGSVVEVGLGKRPPQWFDSLLKARDRSQAGVTAPPGGLYLVRVDYPLLEDKR